LFRGPENAQINTMELRRIKVKIYRNISVKESVAELQRDIVEPEDVIIKRRAGKILHFSKSLHFFKLLYFTEIQLLCSIAKKIKKYTIYKCKCLRLIKQILQYYYIRVKSSTDGYKQFSNCSSV